MRRLKKCSVALVSFLLFFALASGCATSPKKETAQFRNPADSPPTFDWSTIKSTFNEDAFALVSPAQAAGYDHLYFMSDIHGQLIAFTNLLRQAGFIDKNDDNWAGTNDLLVLDGDYIDGGDSSYQVLQLILKLQGQAGSHLIVLLGNHEAEFLADPTTKHLQKTGALKSFGSVTNLDPTVAQLKTFKLGAVVGSWFVAHSGCLVPASGSVSGLITSMSNAYGGGTNGFTQLSDPNGKGPASILERHNWWDPVHKAQQTTLYSLGFNGFIAGHEPDLFGPKSDRNKILISDDGWAVKIDTGLKDAKKDSDTIGEVLKCSMKNVANGEAGLKALSNCSSLDSVGKENTLPNP